MNFDGSEIHTWDGAKTLINNGINYLVLIFFGEILYTLLEINILTYQAGTFESMMFQGSPGGICSFPRRYGIFNPLPSFSCIFRFKARQLIQTFGEKSLGKGLQLQDRGADFGFPLTDLWDWDEFTSMTG